MFSYRAILPVALIALFMGFCVSVADAKPPKIRGYIISVDKDAKTMVIQHKKRGEVSLKWNDSTTFSNGTIDDLAPGKGVRNIMNDPDDGFIRVIRIDPAQDKPAG